MLKTTVHKQGTKLPRLGKKEFSSAVLSHDLYVKAIKESPEFSTLSWKQFQDIWIGIAEEMKKEICSNPLGLKLPFFLGDLKIQYLPYKKQADDKHLSQVVGEVVPHVNIHSKGKMGKLVWERKDARRFNKVLDFWVFDPSDLFEEDVAEALMTNPERFRVAKTRVANKKQAGIK